MKYLIVEKRDHLAVHQIHSSRGSAERSLQSKIPEYCAKGYYMDKTLRPQDFEIIEKGHNN